MAIIPFILQIGRQSPERLKDLPKVTQKGGGRAGSRGQKSCMSLKVQPPLSLPLCQPFLPPLGKE